MILSLLLSLKSPWLIFLMISCLTTSRYSMIRNAYGFSVSTTTVSSSLSSSYSLSGKTIISMSPSSLGASTTTQIDVDDMTESGYYKRDRYIATNRFSVRSSSAGKMEKRWATRQSRLSTLPGFRYFQLMRRVKIDNDGTTRYDEGNDAATSFENYVSFTIWDKKSDFNAWRNGEAFKEAHGGTSIGAFLSTMVNSAMILRGAPKPAFYDSLCMKSSKSISSQQPGRINNGWRDDAKDIVDGIRTLPAESFVVMTKYFVSDDIAIEFEKAYRQLQNNNDDTIGEHIVACTLMRRDGKAKGHGIQPMDAMTEPTYVMINIYNNKDIFLSNYKTKSQHEQQTILQLFPNMRSPETIMYEGTLVITSQQGA